MSQPSEVGELNGAVSSQSLTEQTTNPKRKQLITSPSLTTLTFDLISEILCKLPVKLLLQLQCVCKSFNSLISNPKFAKKHLHSSIKRHHLMVSSTNESQEFLLFDSPIPSVFSASRVTLTQTQLSYPITRKKDGYCYPLSLCSCDGILCFAVDHTYAVLWNPSIRKLSVLPPFKNPRRRVPFSSYSFGYDPFIDNYKTIGISFCIEQNEVSVNTLGTDYWRRIGDFPYSSYVHGSGIFVSGTVNWLAFDSPNSVAIVSLDLAKESYQKLSHPDFGMNSQNLGVLKDCLCIYTRGNINMFLDVWIMKEYGNKESWIKLYSVPYMEDRGLCSYTKALYISEDDQLLVDFYELGSNELKLVVYDSKNGTLKIAEIENINRWMDPKVYVESLISPCS